MLTANKLVTCEVNERVYADSDHYPIRTLLDISTKTPETQRKRNWKTCSIKDLQSFVDLNLQSKAFPLQIKQHIELAIEYLIETINQGIAASTPWAKPSKWANPSFNAECREMIKITRKFRHKYTESVIANGLTDSTTGLREARRGLIPTLKTDGGLAETAEQKVETFRKTFFPELPLADLSDILTAQIPPQIDFPDLTEHEVLRCIRRAPPDKVPGPNGIPNKIFNACLRLGHNPEYFQQSTTVVLRKAAPRDYRIAKSYRPIALLNTLGKILEAVVTVQIAWALEKCNYLPRSHLGGRRSISVDYLIQLLLDQIFESWGKGQKVSMLLLNVAGAFDNVSHIRLLYQSINQNSINLVEPIY
ncbi:uncharacterized protein KD926_009466 [Aspergillus affinis]|uniref:uncharacterized protein n=1 Tax=Aspergillus affinis TaxID=1070780 RepID=UPI0022FE773F|nr:uncharacterized protein KD926_009466 [Aspergillus affinis]KAI9039452.1 hypothetical protein KD926_009466 [Aspergillus affinis]